MELIEYNNHKKLINAHYSFNDLVFVDRVFCLLTECGNDMNYGEYISKFYTCGMIKMLKSLNLYDVKGRGVNKKTYVHPFIALAIDTSILSNEDVAKNIVKFWNGGYGSLPKIEITDYSNYNLIKESRASSSLACYGTYIVYNPNNQLYKIGRSKNVYSRLVTLKKEHGKDVVCIGYCNTDNESVIHYEYRKYRMFGEWFKITSDDILDIFNKYSFFNYDR